MKSDPSATGPQRTVESYNRCVLRARLTESASKGVKENSDLNCLTLFHATSHLPPCIGHDLFEGVVSWDLAAVIEYMVKKKKWFSYKLLSNRIKKFKCLGTDSTNKPAYVQKEGKKLGGHAVQNWMMLRLLYFFSGDKIEDLEDPAWRLYLKLKEMCEIFCAPSFIKEDVPYLKDVLIPEYYEIRSSIGFSKEKSPIRPKHHYMSHYPELMLKYGPLIYLWTLPFEQKHGFFKEVLRKTGNFINPEYSCAVRYQMNFCLTTSLEMFSEEFLEKNSKLLSATSFTGDLVVFLSRLNFFGVWSECEQVSVGAVSYKKNDILMLASRENVITIVIIKVIAVKEDSLKVPPQSTHWEVMAFRLGNGHCGGAINFVTEERKATYDRDVGLYEINFSSLGTFTVQSVSELQYQIPELTCLKNFTNSLVLHSSPPIISSYTR
ncbi:Leucine aminopeptidase 2 [Frankliniella fusca]|uniref:Leucine aminopeptidase 2 n=1 Tax=Frankliniella fusca TaxID=407009 RepID=A0AAE1L909_9NEOP|nr:Leucine aminopeptidase 2 [Frankliniella fusca]